MKAMNDAFAMIRFRHNDLLERAGRFDALLENNDFDSVERSYDSLRQYFETDLLGHFEFEEKVFFVSALVGAPSEATAQLVLGLQKEHGLIMEALRHVPMGADSVQPLKKIFAVLKHHATVEDRDLFPLFERNAMCRATAEDLLARDE